jgi:hypothetical protein
MPQPMRVKLRGDGEREGKIGEIFGEENFLFF